ncbi:hypothetical protein Tco_0516862 [Tanacetum coccineum]
MIRPAVCAWQRSSRHSLKLAILEPKRDPSQVQSSQLAYHIREKFQQWDDDAPPQIHIQVSVNSLTFGGIDHHGHYYNIIIKENNTYSWLSYYLSKWVEAKSLIVIPLSITTPDNTVGRLVSNRGLSILGCPGFLKPLAVAVFVLQSQELHNPQLHLGIPIS